MKSFTYFAFFIFFSSLTLSTPGVAKKIERNLKTTAASFILRRDASADLSSAEYTKRLDQIEAEAKFVFDEVLTPSGQNAFFQPLPFLPELMLSVDEATLKHLEPLLSNGKKLDLKSQNTGLKEFDALNAKHQAKALFLENDILLMLEFPALMNTIRIAKEYNAVPGIKAAAPNLLFSFGGKQVQRLGDRPAIYQFTVGWGDCPAGCIYKHRRYYEIYWNGQDSHRIEKIGQTGDRLEDNREDPNALNYFQDTSTN